jgi:hypothetical protein
MIATIRRGQGDRRRGAAARGGGARRGAPHLCAGGEEVDSRARHAGHGRECALNGAAARAARHAADREGALLHAWGGGGVGGQPGVRARAGVSE